MHTEPVSQEALINSIDARDAVGTNFQSLHYKCVKMFSKSSKVTILINYGHDRLESTLHSSWQERMWK